MTSTGDTGVAQAGDCADVPLTRAAAQDNGQLELQFFPETEVVSIAHTDEHQVSLREAAVSSAPDASTMPAQVEADTPAANTTMSVGSRLRSERERRGWTRDDVAARLKWQASLVRRIEEDDYQGIEHAVYLRGYFGSYTRLLGMPGVIADHVVATHAQETPLVSTGTISRSRYLLDRYSVSATYLILTGLVIGPAVWLATHGGLEQNLARTVLLDTSSMSTTVEAPGPATGSAASNTTRSGIAATAMSVPPPTQVAQDPLPIVASMAPFSALPQPAAPSIADPAQANTLTLKLKQASWVEVTAASGEKLEYSLLGAGTQRTYASDGEIDVRIGNAEGADIIVDGKPMDLAPFRRANVAHLKLFGADQHAVRVEY